MILIFFTCQNSSLDCSDTVKKFIEELMEQSILTKLLVNATKSNLTILKTGQTR